MMIIVSCNVKHEPISYNYYMDTYSVTFSGDTDAFRISYSAQTSFTNSILLDKDSICVPYISVKDVSKTSDNVFYFKYPDNGKYSFVFFSCTAICTVPNKILHGRIKRQHYGTVVDEEDFYLKSVDVLNMDFTRDDYLFSINL